MPNIILNRKEHTPTKTYNSPTDEWTTKKLLLRYCRLPVAREQPEQGRALQRAATVAAERRLVRLVGVRAASEHCTDGGR
ncbi:hypothetical protein E3N88_40102 [Mikania micrantha]|uniref:Uncharacterized protein n=1 Tax=Mikania micrantha TaxID=192012 RepID=A0A5N6LLR2_9ASTR|nr:hypothetical protein E3N88_40102 [Mikania micrantha]